MSIGIYAAVLQALGLLDGLCELADPAHDAAGVATVTEHLPQRIRLRRPSGATMADIEVQSAKAIVKEVALVAASWREVATAAGATRREIDRVASAFANTAL